MFFAYLLILALIITIAVISSSNQKEIRQLRSEMNQKVQQRDQQWRSYLEAFKTRVKTDTERSLLERLLRGDAGQADSSQTPASPADTPIDETQRFHADQPAAHAPAQSPATTAIPTQVSPEPVAKTSQPLDNALLLLYLGAFLFVVAAGLFVGFADFSGEARTMIVALVAALFYGSGLYLYKHKDRLKPAGVSFAAIGMAIAPLVGLSLYSYVFDQSNGSFVWLVTSLAVFGLYLHALYSLRSGFVSYLLILSFVSMMQSAVSIIDAPIHYFVWALIITGLILKLISPRVTALNLPELREPAEVSSQVIVPLSIFVSLLSAGQHGAMQLAITFAFAAIFYGLSALSATDTDQKASLWQASHLLGLLALTTGAYDIRQSIIDVAITLLAVTVLHTVVLLGSRFAINQQAIGTTALLATLPMVLFALDSSVLLLLSVIATVVFGVALAYRQNRVDGLVFAIFGIGLLPYIIGLRIIDPPLDGSPFALLTLSAPLVIVGLRLLLQKQQRHSWLSQTSLPFIIVTFFTVLPAIFVDSTLVSVVIAISLAVVYAWLGKVEQRDEWVSGSAIVVLTAVAHGSLLFHNPELFASALVALVWCIALALRFRNELSRWIGSVLWLIMPLIVTVRGLDATITSAQQSWLYIVVLVGFIFARAIVRLRSSNATEASKALTAQGNSYIVGYWTAGFLSLCFALFADNVSLQLSLVSAVLILSFWAVSRYVEEDRNILAVIPLLLQLFVYSILQTTLQDAMSANLYIFMSTLTAVTAYLIYKLEVSSWIKQSESWHSVAMATLFIAPFSVFFVGQTEIMMPIGLAIAGVIALLESWRERQASRELMGAIIVAAIMWLMSYFGVENLQAYTHVLALVFAIYALWRFAVLDKKTGDQYLMAMFFTATVPLVLQALGGTAGDLYGWWLIFQQVGFVLLGMVTGKKFLSKWGLYVTIGSVLYQMRELEWVVLGILAMSIIGAALYYLSRQSSE